MAKFLASVGKTLGLTSLILIVASFGAPGFPMDAEAIGDQTITRLTNQQRDAKKLPPLAWNADLASSALAKAQDMCQQDYWSHANPQGDHAWGLIEDSGYRYRYAGENLAKGYNTDDQRLFAWMNSPSHRANILNHDYKEIGSATITCDFQGQPNSITVAHYGSQ